MHTVQSCSHEVYIVNCALCACFRVCRCISRLVCCCRCCVQCSAVYKWMNRPLNASDGECPNGSEKYFLIFRKIDSRCEFHELPFVVASQPFEAAGNLSDWSNTALHCASASASPESARTDFRALRLRRLSLLDSTRIPTHQFER